MENPLTLTKVSNQVSINFLYFMIFKLLNFFNWKTLYDKAASSKEIDDAASIFNATFHNSVKQLVSSKSLKSSKFILRLHLKT